MELWSEIKRHGKKRCDECDKIRPWLEFTHYKIRDPESKMDIHVMLCKACEAIAKKKGEAQHAQRKTLEDMGIWLPGQRNLKIR